MPRSRQVGWMFRVALGLVVAFACTPLKAEEPKSGKYALLVGIKDYDSGKLSSLKYTENDVAELATVLRAAGYEVVLLTGTEGKKDAKARPTRENIEKQLKGLLAKCKKGDTMLVALAGHGLQFDKDEDSFFCPEDAIPQADEESRKTLLSLKQIYGQLDKSSGAVKLLLVDACRNDPSGGRSVDPKNVRAPDGVAALYSCSKSERAYEVDNYRHGIFFHHVLEGLRGKAKNGDDEVTWDGLQAYVRKQVSADAPKLLNGAQQTPSLNAGELRGEPPVLIGRNVKLVSRAILAIQLAPLERNTAERLQIPQRLQPQVTFVIPGGGGDAMGLRRGDLVQRVNGRDVATVPQTVAALRELALGERVELTVLRDKQQLKLIGRNETTIAEAEELRRVREMALKDDADALQYLGNLYELGRGTAKDEAEAARWYRKAAEMGSIEAQFSLGNLYEMGRAVKQDYAEAAKWYRKAADQGHAVAQDKYGSMCFIGSSVKKDLEEAVQWYRKAAEQGNASGQFNLGWMYENGSGVAQDKAEAAKWYHKAAEQNHAIAQYGLGTLYELGLGVKKDEVEAARWYRKAAEQRMAMAQDHYGTMLFEGRGVAKDEAEAAKWYRKAAEQGNSEGQLNLGWIYEYGRGVQKDTKEAAKWYRKAADQDHLVALNNLGLLYARGDGVPKDEAMAAKLYRKAADKGLAGAQNNYGSVCFYGLGGVAKDEREAVKWYRKAAEQGHANGQFNLGWMYEYGSGVNKDQKEALKWYEKAAAQGDEEAIQALKRLKGQ